MKTRVQKWGNSLAVRIPKLSADQLHLNPDSQIELEIRDGSLTLKPMPAPEAYDLEEMLAGVTPEQIHAETDTGAPVGLEIW